MNARMLSSLILAVATGSTCLVAQAQYTPGSGAVGGYNPGAPATPQPAPVYAWETPPAPQLVPAPADQIRIAQADQQIIVPRLSDGQLADLTASIALYSDPLLATMLPAATYVDELTYADRWLAQHPGADEYAISTLPLDPSVKSMMHYPTALTVMVEHVDWTQALGVAFMYQRDGLMDSIQRWRMTAVTCGTLASSPQQEVYERGQTIIIVPPPQVQVVYVPVYDPRVVYVRPARPRPPENFISFTAGGFSLTFIENDVDWHDHQVRVPVHHDHDGPPIGRGRDSVGRRDSTVTVPPAPTAPRTPPPAATASGRGERGGSRSETASTVAMVTTEKPVEKTVFVRESLKPNVVYPQKITTPQPDHKVVEVMTATTDTTTAAARPATAPATNPGRGRGRGNGG